MEYEREFKMDPNDARGKYCCRPQEISSPFFEHPEKIDWCVDKDRQPIIETEDYEEDGYIKKRIVQFKTDSMFKQHIITIDLGLVSDSAAVALWHKEQHPTLGEVIIQDYVGAWKPDKSKNLTVSLTDIEKFILNVNSKLQLVGCYFDQWNSALLSQRLNEASIKSEIVYLNFQDFKNYKSNIYEGKIELLNNPVMLTEIKRLIMTRANRIDHPIDGSKDLSDCVTTASKILLGTGVSGSTGNGLEGDILITDNLASAGGTIIGS